MGRTPNQKTQTRFRCSDETYEKLESYAKLNGKSFNFVVNTAIENFLSEKESNENVIKSSLNRINERLENLENSIPMLFERTDEIANASEKAKNLSLANLCMQLYFPIFFGKTFIQPKTDIEVEECVLKSKNFKRCFSNFFERNHNSLDEEISKIMNEVS